MSRRGKKKVLSQERFIEITYEDFVGNPLQTIASLLKQCGLEDSISVRRYLKYLGHIQDMNTKYRSLLAAEELAVVEKATKDTAYKAGYVF